MRYRTALYVASTEDAALRLAELDGTPKGRIRRADAQLLHQGKSFAFWSDGAVTDPVEFLDGERPACLSCAAVEIFEDAAGSDSVLPRCLMTVAKISELHGTETIECGDDRFPYDRARTDRLDVELLDGTRTSLYRYTVGYSDGYAYNLAESLDELRKQI